MDTPKTSPAVTDGVFESAPDPIFVHDIDSGAIVDVNGAAVELFGGDRGQMRGQTIQELVPKTSQEQQERAAACFQTAVETGSASLEWAPTAPTGEQLFLAVQLERTIIDGDEYVLAFVHDNSVLKKRQDELREQKLLREAVFNSPEVFIGLLDADGTLIEANQTALEFATVDAESVAGKPFSETVWWNDNQEKQAKLEAAIRTAQRGEHTTFTTEHTSGRGQRIAVSVVVRPVFDGGEVDYIIVEGTDITSQRDREKELRERSEELETLVKNLPVVLFTTDIDGVFTRSVGKGLEQLELEPGELVGESIYDVYGDQTSVIEAFKSAVDGTESRATNEIEDLVFETWYRPIVADDGTVTEVVGVARDVTENKQRENRIEAIGEASQDLLRSDSPEAVANVVLGIADRVIGEDTALIRLYDEEADVLRPVHATSGSTRIARSHDQSELPTIEAGHDEMAAFKAGESRLVRDYEDLDNPAIPESWVD